jgi:hypothetical protein
MYDNFFNAAINKIGQYSVSFKNGRIGSGEKQVGEKGMRALQRQGQII